MRMEVPLDPVRKPLREHRQEAIESGGLIEVEGWVILSLMIQGKITVEQCAKVNSLRVHQVRGHARRKAA